MSESASGEATDSSTADNKGSSVTCPTCGRDGFKNERGMKCHHKMAHGESIAGIVVECHTCGSKFREQKAAVDNRENVFCSRECYYDTMERRKSRECVVCGDEFEYHSHRNETARFCSYDCYFDWRSSNIVGENHPNWKGGKPKSVCEYCGEEFTGQRANKNKFCCKRCAYNWYSENLVGEDHPQYDPEKEDRFGRNWVRQRRKRIKEDQGRCQVCGATPIDTGRSNDVHHIRPRKWFIQNYDEPEWWKKANDLENLITLCRSCHRKWEGVPLRPLTN